MTPGMVLYPQGHTAESWADKLILDKIGARYVGARLDQIDAGVRDHLGAALDGASLFLSGGVGTGKTHALAAVMSAAAVAGKSPRYASVPHLMAELRGKVKRDLGEGEPTAEQVVQGLSSWPLLLLDDLGAESPSTWVQETLYRIVDARYTNLLPMVVASNLSLESLIPFVGERTADRLGHACRAVRLSAISRRRA